MWVQCKGHSNLEVTKEGAVRRKILSKFDKTVKSSKDGYYYPDLRITDNGYSVVSDGGKDLYIHRLIAETFIENPDTLPCVNHIDGNKQNNDISNLEWCTSKQNSIHAVKNGLIKTGKDSHMFGKTGCSHPCHAVNLGNTYNLGRKRSAESRNKISNKLKGNTNALGHKHSEESKEKMRQAALIREAKRRKEKEFNA